MAKEIELSTICKVVAEYYNIEPVDVFSISRKREVIKRRQWFQYLARTLTEITSDKIGKYYSDITGIIVDHATVLSNAKKIRGFIEVLPNGPEAAIERYLTLKIRLESGVINIPSQNTIPDGYLCEPTAFKISRKKTHVAKVLTLSQVEEARSNAYKYLEL